MAIPRRMILIASSVLLILIIALSLATAIEIKAPPTKIIQVAVAQGVMDADLEDDLLKGKGRVNGTGFDRGEIWSGTTEISPGMPSTVYLTYTPKPDPTKAAGGTVLVPLPGAPTPTMSMYDEGCIGPCATPEPPPPPPVMPPPGPQLPIVALSYTGNGGPKHCRGELLQEMSFAQPASDWKNGTCIDLPGDARCGVFFAGKDDKCEAHLFNMQKCVNTTESYVNTVVFLPEERPVGALWRSMFVRCGVEAEEPGLLDPSLLDGLLKKPGGKVKGG